MAVWTRDDVKAFAPEFASVSDGVLDLFLTYAEPQVSERALGPLAKLAGVLLTAHLLKRFGPGSAAAGAASGTVASTTVGEVSVSYAVPSLDAAELRAGLGLTRYGIEFARLVRIRALGAQVL